MTIKDVAAEAGVSVSSVSRYFNGGSLSPEKAQRIREAIERMGYRPNQAAQTLRTGQQKQVGMIVPRIHSSAVSRVVAGVTSTLQEAGYWVLLGNTDGDDARELQYLELMQESRVAGILLMGTTLTHAKLDGMRRCQVPLVITGQNFSGLPCVYHDDFQAVYELTARMLQKGRRNIAYIGVTEQDTASGLARRKGAQAALTDAGLNGEYMPRAVSEFNVDDGHRQMQQLLAKYPTLDGVVCATDTIAHGAMLALREAGRSVPDQVSVAGVGDSWADAISIPPLTTAQLYHEQCGQEAAKLLLGLIRGEAPAVPAKHIQLGYSIRERGSL